MGEKNGRKSRTFQRRRRVRIRVRSRVAVRYTVGTFRALTVNTLGYWSAEKLRLRILLRNLGCYLLCILATAGCNAIHTTTNDGTCSFALELRHCPRPGAVTYRLVHTVHTPHPASSSYQTNLRLLRSALDCTALNRYRITNEPIIMR